MNSYDEYTSKFREYYNKLKGFAIGDKLVELSESRKISLDELESAEVIYIDNGTKLLIPEFISYARDFGIVSPTNNRPIFNNRYVFPIKDWNGNIVNLVGYSKESDERYVYGTGEWYRRRDMMYGLENLDYAYRVGWGILVEGISDTWAIRQYGLKNVFGNCGVEFSDLKKKQLSRLRYGVIQIPDRDRPGLKLKKNTELDKKVCLFVPIQYKDIAEAVENGVEIIDAIKDIANWMVEHGGLMRGFAEEVSM